MTDLTRQFVEERARLLSLVGFRDAVRFVERECSVKLFDAAAGQD